MTERFYVDGAPVERDRFVVSGLDEGFTVGLNVFETLRTYYGRCFRLEPHAARLVQSAATVGVPCPPADALIAEVRSAVSAARSTGAPDDDYKVRVMLTMGGRRLLHVARLDPARLAVAPGARVRAATRRWEPVAWLDGNIKHGSRAAGEVARRAAGVDEILWVGHDGCLTEGTRSSIFAVVDGGLITPPVDHRILDGITRGALLQAAADDGLPVREASLPLSAEMTELYSISTLREIAPVVELDGRPAPGAGPLGARLATAFRALVARECGGP